MEGGGWRVEDGGKGQWDIINGLMEMNGQVYTNMDRVRSSMHLYNHTITLSRI